MSEILIKTYTRHRDTKDPFYMHDWTAWDVVQIMPDGYWGKNKHQGGKYLGIVLQVEADIPHDFAGKVAFDLDEKLKSRTDKIIDLSKILTDQQLKDCFNHDYLMHPIKYNGSYLNLFEPRANRTELHSYDKSGSFSSGSVDVGPNGHADANTFFEFESNLADPLTGALTGNTDEGSWNETNGITLVGTTTSAANYLVFSASNGGRHQGQYDTDYHYLDIQDDVAIYVQEDYVRLDGLQFNLTETSLLYVEGVRIRYLTASNNDVRISNCIMKGNCSGTGSARGIRVYTDSIVTIWNNIIYDIISGSDTGFSGIYFGGGTVELTNNLIQNCYYGLNLAGGTVDVYNTTVFDCSDDFNGAFNTIDYCASDDGDGNNSVSPSGGDWDNEFENYGTDDFRLLTTGNLFQAGDNDPTGSSYGDPDIIAASRPVAPTGWSIGPFEPTAPPSGPSDDELRRRKPYGFILGSIGSMPWLAIGALKANQLLKKRDAMTRREFLWK